MISGPDLSGCPVGLPVSDEIWEAEDIPSDDALYVYVHCQWIRNGRIVPGFFKNRPDEETGAMSTDWCKYSTPDETRHRARKLGVNGVGRLHVEAVWKIGADTAFHQTVVHTPIQHSPDFPDNRAHTDVRGPKETADLDVQFQFSEICTLVRSVPTPDDPACQQQRKRAR